MKRKIFRKVLCIAVSALMLCSCGNIVDNAKEAYSKVREAGEEFAEKLTETEAKTAKESSGSEETTEEASESFRDQGEAEVFFTGTAPEHFSLTAKYFAEEEEQDIPIKTGKINNIIYAAYDGYAICGGISVYGTPESEEVEILSEYQGQPVTEISGRSFNKSDVLKKIIIPDTVEKIGDEAFMDCVKLEIAETHGDIGEKAFSGCTSLKTVTVCGDIGERAFEFCNELEKVTMTGGEKIGRYAFYDEDKISGCKKLSEMTFPDSLEYIGKYAFSGTPFDRALRENGGQVMFGKVLYRSGAAENAETVSIPDGTVMLGDFCFVGLDNLRHIDIPEGVKYIGYEAISCCNSLETVMLPDSLIRLEDGVFIEDDVLDNVVLPKNLEYMGAYCFERCKALKNIEINEKLGFIGSHAFDYTAWQDERHGLVVVNGILVRCTSFHNEYTVPDGVIAVADGAFSASMDWRCYAEKVTLPDTVEYIGKSAFYEAFTDVNIPAGVKIIADQAYFAANITEAIIPEGVEELGESCFAYCTDLKEAVIPEGVKKIPDHMFWECPVMADLTVPESVWSIGKGAVYHMESITVHCKKNSYADMYFSTSKKKYI